MPCLAGFIDLAHTANYDRFEHLVRANLYCEFTVFKAEIH